MNENNQPQSQQTKRERGLYHVKRNGYWTVAEYTDHHGQWRVFNNTDQMQSRDFEEIDERRIERASSESSHSPTEQPGDAKHTPTPWIPWETPMVHQGKYFQCPVESAHPDGIINVAMAFGATREECKANADLIARAPALLSEVSTLRSKQAELVAENERLKADVDRLKAAPDYDPLTSEEVWKLIETYKKAGWYDDEFVLEIERQASELDKLRTENEKLQNSNTVLAEGYRRLNKALEEVELHLGPYKWCNINEYIECKRIISAAVNPPEL